LIARGHEPAINAAVGDLAVHGTNPVHRARALWVWHAIEGDPIALFALTEIVHRGDMRIREQAVRMLGRDCRENGKVEFTNAEAKPPAPILKHLEALPALVDGLADDPDAGVRRELILAIRNLPTAKVGKTLRKLAAAWDGQDRWYLEALGLALDRRESDFIAELMDGTLYGRLDPAAPTGSLALPPYFPIDRNEAYIPTGTVDRPASALSKTLGLAWRLHRVEAVPLLSRVLPALDTPELQQAADDVLAQMRDPQTAVMLAGLASKAGDSARKRRLISTLSSKLDTAWRGAQQRPEIVALTESVLKDPELRLEAVGLAAATGDPRYAPTLMALARDAKATDEVRATAVEAAARIHDPAANELLISLIEETRGKPIATPAAQAAVRSLVKVEDPRLRLAAILGDAQYPIGLRREALRAYSLLSDGGSRLVAMARDGTLPADLRTEATTALAFHPDRRVRMDASEALPMPKTRGGEPLPPFFMLVRTEGKVDRGRDVFYREGANSCGSCHRVQGRGRWIGPDLSTIGVKYGRDELVRSILSPSAAIGYNFRSAVVALHDGRVLTGLPVEDTSDRLVLKTADGQRTAIRPDQIEERKSSDVSLMPEGLAETMTNSELIDLLTYLSSLKQPVSIIGQYQMLGPIAGSNGTAAIDPAGPIDLTAAAGGASGKKLYWRRVVANAENLVDLSALAGIDPSHSVYLYAPVFSPDAQQAKLVLDTTTEMRVWLAGKPLALPPPSEDHTRTLNIELPQGQSTLLIRTAAGPGVSLVTTFVTDKPIAFQGAEEKASNP
jgi:putative heme-binding domain-containing protein